MRNIQIKKCPKCGSVRVAPILYGLPAFSEDLDRRIRSEEIYLGGCCRSEFDAQYHCFSCKKGIGTPPVLISRYGIEDYRDIVTSIHFSDGGFFGGFDEVHFQKNAAGIVVKIVPSFTRETLPVERAVKADEWQAILDKLFCALCIHEWRKSYNDYSVLDGEQWAIELRLTNGRQRNIYGSNAFPPYWQRLKRLLKPYFDECPPKGIEESDPHDRS